MNINVFGATANINYDYRHLRSNERLVSSIRLWNFPLDVELVRSDLTVSQLFRARDMDGGDYPVHGGLIFCWGVFRVYSGDPNFHWIV
ncbi:hypothetical protein OROMI_015424 [Orobanche minor]